MADIDASLQSATALQSGAEHAAYHMEDVHRAGGVLAILGELARSGRLNKILQPVHNGTIDEATGGYLRITSLLERFKAGPAGIPTEEAFVNNPLACAISIARVAAYAQA